MSNIMQARVILRHGNAADFDATAVETAELVFASDVGIIYIKKNDGTILAIGPHVESSDNKVVDPEASIAAADKANKFPSLAYIEGNYDKSSEVTSKINTAKTELQRIIRQQADGVASNSTRRPACFRFYATDSRPANQSLSSFQEAAVLRLMAVMLTKTDTCILRRMGRMSKASHRSL